MKVGRRLAVKILNVSRFVLGLGAATLGATVTQALDRSMIAELAAVVDEATAALDGYEYTRALERTEQFFWRFCDDYVELVKARAYGERGQAAADSARVAMAEALSVMLRLFAPFLPYVTEEVWSWWREGSIHRAEWPTAETVRDLAAGVDGTPLAVASQVIAAIRKAKSEAKLSVRADVAAALVRAEAGLAEVLRSVADDVCAAGRVASLDIEIGDEPEVVTRVRL